MLRGIKNITGRAFPRLKDYSRIRAGFRGQFGRSPNVFFPKTFSDKIQRQKLFGRDQRYPQRVDKIAVKEFVSEKLDPSWVTPTLWFGIELPAAPQWPTPFVLKASHGSAMNFFARENVNWREAKRLAKLWMSLENYGDFGAEWAYSKVRPRLLIEPFISEIAALPTDYKLWTFNGRVEFIQVDTDRETNHKRTMFDRDWKRLPFTTIYPIDNRPIERPQTLLQMLDAAAILSEAVPFVRVDLYEINKKPRFGELTYYPESGWGPFFPAEYDRTVGDMMRFTRSH